MNGIQDKTKAEPDPQRDERPPRGVGDSLIEAAGGRSRERLIRQKARPARRAALEPHRGEAGAEKRKRCAEHTGVAGPEMRGSQRAPRRGGGDEAEADDDARRPADAKPKNKARALRRHGARNPGGPVPLAAPREVVRGVPTRAGGDRRAHESQRRASESRPFPREIQAEIIGFCYHKFVKLPKEWSVYMARCVDGSLYTGIAKDVRARVTAHNSGRGAAYTRARRPVKLVYIEEGFTQSTALSREARIKALARAEKLALVKTARGRRR
jgi:putative endonuclease